MMMIRVGPDDFDPAAELAALGSAGAVVSFTGHVRAEPGLIALTLEHYPAMTTREIARHAEEARARWPLGALRIVHRIGRLTPGARIVFVGTASRHRQAAFEACEFLIDYLKVRAPFWKLEERESGDRWVEAKASDDRAAARWK